MEVPINYLAVLISAIAAVVIGGLWYGPLFGKMWMKLAGISKEGMKSMALSPLQAMVGGFIVSFLMAYVLAHGIVFGNAYTNMSGMTGGLMGAFWYWLGFIVPVTAGVFLWEGKSAKLWLLNAAYYLVSLSVMGAILSSWV
jgi:hypothetical protein